MDNGWFRTLTRDDITLNPHGAAEVRPHSVVGGDGAEHEVDVLVLATGFDVVRFLAPIEIVGRSGGRSARRGTTTTPRPTSAPSCPTCRTSSACTGRTCRPATAAAC